jgi:lantibiotic modifying enzyme
MVHDFCHEFFGAPKVQFVLAANYGWMEFLGETESGEVDLFRLGQVLSLLTVLRSSDHHPENILVQEKWPIFVDLECSLVPEMTFQANQDGLFLPDATRIFDFNQMLFGEPLIRGFQEGLDVIIAARSRLVDELRQIASVDLRVVIRQTKFYLDMISYFLRPQVIGPESRRHRWVTDMLIKITESAPEICALEARAITRGVVPKITYRSTQDVLMIEGLSVSGLVSRPGLPLALQALTNETFLESLRNWRPQGRKKIPSKKAP